MSPGFSPPVSTEAISGTKIIGPTLPLIADNSTANLTCTSSAGKADSVLWYKDGKLLDNTNRRIILTTDNRTVTILPVQKNDAGSYRCQLMNKISSEVNNYTLTVNCKLINKSSSDDDY